MIDGSAGIVTSALHSTQAADGAPLLQVALPWGYVLLVPKHAHTQNRSTLQNNFVVTALQIIQNDQSLPGTNKLSKSINNCVVIIDLVLYLVCGD